MTEDEKRSASRLFDPSDPELKEQKRKAHHLSMDFNRPYEEETEQRSAILSEVLGDAVISDWESLDTRKDTERK